MVQYNNLHELWKIDATDVTIKAGTKIFKCKRGRFLFDWKKKVLTENLIENLTEIGQNMKYLYGKYSYKKVRHLCVRV